MGSWGSGRWGFHNKATTVEDCHVLDLGDFARKGAFVPWHTGSVSWSRGAEVVATIGYSVRPAGNGLILHLSYHWTRGETGGDVELPIRLENTPLYFGGLRWWGICPLVLNEQVCGRRVGKLYLPPGGCYFGCRTCYRLTYRSAQEHDKRVDALRRNPAALNAILANPAAHIQSGHVGLAIKALRQ